MSESPFQVVGEGYAILAGDGSVVLDIQPTPLTARQTDAGPRSTCCNAAIKVTRVVHDVVTYDPVEVYDDGPTATASRITLTVRFGGKTDSLDSDGYVATCSGCGVELDVEVEEQ